MGVSPVSLSASSAAMVPSVSQYGKLGPKHLPLPEAFDDSDVSNSSTGQSHSQEEIIQMRQELMQRRLLQTSQDSESRELNTDESASTEHNLAAGAQKDLADLAERTSISIKQLETLRKDGILDRMPRNSNGEFTSVGSLGHEDKACQPCIFWIQVRC